jgi:hypothetical protein
MPWRGPPLPTGTVDQAARQETAGFYRGILAAAPVVVTGTVGVESWTQALVNDIEAAMRAMGYVLTDDETTITDNRYTLGVQEQFGVEYRGTIKGGLLRVSGRAVLRVQHRAKPKNRRWMRTIGESQEEIVVGLYGMTTQVGVFETAELEDVEGGHVSVIAFTFRGYHE